MGWISQHVRESNFMDSTLLFRPTLQSEVTGTSEVEEIWAVSLVMAEADEDQPKNRLNLSECDRNLENFRRASVMANKVALAVMQTYKNKPVNNIPEQSASKKVQTPANIIGRHQIKCFESNAPAIGVPEVGISIQDTAVALETDQ